MIQLILKDRFTNEFKRLVNMDGPIAIATPVWKLGVASAFGLKPQQSIRILCCFDSVACDPQSLAELQAIGASIRSHPHLNANLYMAGEEVIVGSSTSLQCSLSRTEDAIEANLLTNDKSVVESADRLFNKLWNAPITTHITSQMIENEISRRKTQLRNVPAPRKLSKDSLLAACREAPELFGTVFVCAYKEDLGEEGQAVFGRGRKKAYPERNNPTLLKDGEVCGYQFEEGPLEGTWIVDVNCMESNRCVSGASQVPTPAPRMQFDDEYDLTITVVGNVKVPGAIGEFVIPAQEKEELLQIVTCH